MPTYQNLFTNPLFETASGTVTVRTNLCKNPTPASATGYTGAGPVMGTMSDGAPCVSTTTTTATTPFVWTAADPNAAASGDTYAMSAVVEILGAPAGMTFAVRAHGVTGNVYFGSGALTITPTGAPQTVSIVSTLNAAVAAGELALSFVAASAASGVTVRVAKVLIEKATVNLPYFDGSTAASGDFSYAWTGTANASTSIQTAPALAAGVNNSANFCTAYQSSAWAAAGAKSARITPNTASAESFAYLGSKSAGFEGLLTAGQSYTAIGTIRLAAPQTGVLSAYARTLTAVTNGTGGGTVSSSQAPNVAGQFEVRVSFAVPADATGASLRAYNGASSGNGDVWWDSICLVPITDVAHPYTGGYFDGSSTSSFGYAASWDGPVDASTSTLQTIEIAVTPYLDENPSPRAEVLVQDPPAGFVTLTLFAEKRGFPVPGGIMRAAAAGVPVLDTSVPFGIPITYQAQFFDPSGISLGFLTSDPVTVDCADTWVSQPLDPTLAVKVDLDDASATDLTRAFDGDTVYTDGATVGVWVGGRRRGLEGVTLNIETAAAADADMLQQILGGYDIDQVPVICVRTPPGYTRLPRLLYMTAPKPTESDVNVRYGGSLTIMRITGDEVRRPAPGLITPLLGYDDIDAFFGTYSAIDANYGSYLARDRDYSKAGYAG